MNKLDSVLPGPIPMLVLVLTACSGGGTPAKSGTPEDAGDGDVAIGPDSSGLVLAHAYDVRVEQNYRLRCKLCPCGAFVAVNPQAEACTGAILDRYADAKTRMLCTIDGEEQYGRCLADATDCTAADACNAARTQTDMECPAFDDAAAMITPPAACRGLSM